MKNIGEANEIIKKAFQSHSKGNILEAKKYYEQFVNKGFKDERVFSNLGLILKYLGKLKEAELYTSKAIQLNPNFAMAYSNLGNIFRDLGKLNEAKLSYQKAIQLNPNYANAHSNLGNIFRDLGKLNEAEIYTRKAIELNPNLEMAHSNLGSILRDLGKLNEAELSYHKAIQIKPDFADALLNLGSILSDLGKLNEAEIYTRKAIELNPNLEMAHSNLGGILINIGNLNEAEASLNKSIELNPDFSKAYYSLSLLKNSYKNKIWQKKLFSKSILNNKLKKDQIDIYFARANILHKEKNYEESSKYLKLANNLKLELNQYKIENLLNKSLELLTESNQIVENEQAITNPPESIFIVGMPRSGSTLLESILSMSKDSYDLGENNILEESFLKSKKSTKKNNLSELYLKKINHKTKLNITTNKWLYNYQYAGIIAKNIPNVKIIHCFRNPLDNILSIYRANFAQGNQYSSSLVDSAKVYLDQEKVMTEYKKQFKAIIYNLNYDSLVSNPNQEIKSLISWLGWKWDDKYLSPHLNRRSISTASSIQVRSPINSKSLGGWKNYKEMLQPAIEVFSKTEEYKNLTS